MAKDEKPRRTYGISLAIIASVILFSLLPILQVIIVLAVTYRFNNQMFESGISGDATVPFAVGVEFLGLSLGNLGIQVVLGIVFFVIAVLAWRGKPAVVHPLFIAAVIGLSLLGLITTLASLTNAGNSFNTNGIDSGAGLQRSLLCSQIGATLVIPLYVIWYMNRGPARAFYRGAYLPRKTPESSQED